MLGGFIDLAIFADAARGIGAGSTSGRRSFNRHAGSNDASGGTAAVRVIGTVVDRRALAMPAPPVASASFDNGKTTAATIAATAPAAASAAVNQSIDLTRVTRMSCLELLPRHQPNSSASFTPPPPSETARSYQYRVPLALTIQRE